MSNAKKYNAYNSVNIEGEDTSDYPKDSYVSNELSGKNVGKLDEYSKEKELYNKKKSKVVLNQNQSSPQEKKLDDLIPSDIGDAIDNVFSSVDSFLNKTGKLLFGGPKKKPAPKAKARPKPVVSQSQARPAAAKPKVQEKPKPVQAAPQPVQAQKSVNEKPKTVPAQNVSRPHTPQAANTKKPVEEKDNSPPVSRTTSISDLDIPLEMLEDQDLVRYFDQMKLYDKKVPGGLCTLTFNQATKKLKNGRWGKMYLLSYDRLKINTMMGGAEAGKQRYNGMLPVYKAMAKNFENMEALKKAIEEDINLYLKTGEGSKQFHKFTYQIFRKR